MLGAGRRALPRPAPAALLAAEVELRVAMSPAAGLVLSLASEGVPAEFERAAVRPIGGRVETLRPARTKTPACYVGTVQRRERRQRRWPTSLASPIVMDPRMMFRRGSATNRHNPGRSAVFDKIGSFAAIR